MTAPDQAVDRPAARPANAVPEPVPSRIHGRSLPWWAGPVAVLAVAGLWLALRPSSPRGVAASVDLLVLPALLLAEGRLLAWRSTLSNGELAVTFGLGGVMATLVAFLLQGMVAQLLDPAAAGAAGAVVEVLAPCLPVVLVAALLVRDGREPAVVDLALAGLASGLGFLVVQASLVTAVAHRAPAYVSPVVAGWLRAYLPSGLAPMSFVGPAVATGLIGLGLGAAVRWRDQPWRLAPPLLAVCLVAADRVVFERQLRHAAVGATPPPSGLVDAVRQLTSSGRVELVLLVVGLAAFGLAETGRSRSRPSSDETPAHGGDDRGDDGGDDEAVVPHAAEHGAAAPDRRVAEPAADPDRPGPPGGVLGVAVAVAAGIGFLVLARTRHLGFLQDRSVALALAVAGLAYSLLRLAALRCPTRVATAAAEDDEDGAPGDPEGGEADASALLDSLVYPATDSRQVLCMGAIAASGLGVVCALLPAPLAVPPVHGALLYDAVRGWAATVGNLGLLLALGALAAPPGPVRPQTARGWRDVLPSQIRSSIWWRGLAPRGPRLGRGGSWRLRLGGEARGDGTRSRLGWRRGRWRAGAGAAAGFARHGRASGRLPRLAGRWRPQAVVAEEAEAAEPTITLTIEPVDESARSQTEFEAPTVQEAMRAALRHHPIGMSHGSLQLVDAGAPAKPGKPGTGRPARVRVLRARADADLLLPPGRDSIVRTTALAVVVDIVEPAGAAPVEGRVVATDAVRPASIEVTLSNPARPSELRVLVCAREESSPERTRYRSNPYVVDGGEDRGWVRAPAVPARSIRVRDGEQVRVAHGSEATTVTVFDTWAKQVVGVHRGLLDRTAAHHVTAMAGPVLPAPPGRSGPVFPAPQGRSGPVFPASQGRSGPVFPAPQGRSGPERQPPGADQVERLRAGLAAVDEARRLLSSPAPDDEKAFLGTAWLHLAMMPTSGAGSTAVVEAATAALHEHRRQVQQDPARDVGEGPFRHFLESTALGRLWADGAGTSETVADLLG